MFITKGNIELKLTLRRRKIDGGIYYFAKHGHIEYYLFAHHQYWGGITENTSNGAFMFKVDDHEKFQKFGVWQRQKDKSIIIYIEIANKKFGLVGIWKKSSIWLYWADSNNSLQKLIIENNFD